MSYFMIIREAGPGWRAGGIERQTAVGDHAAFMNGLAADGFVLFAGPLSGTERGRIRALLVVNAKDEAEIDCRLAGDPWVQGQQLVTAGVEEWNILVGEERLVAVARA